MRQVFVDRDDVYTIATQSVEIGRQCCNQCLALTSPHLSDIALMQDHTADQLYVERTQAQCTPCCLTRNGEGLLQDVVKRLIRLQATAEFIRFLRQIRIAERLDLLLERVDPANGFRILAQQPLVTATKNFG